MFDITSISKVERTTKLYTKIFTQETWDKLDFPMEELGYSMTMQKYLESKYTIIIREEEKKVDLSVDHNTKSLLEQSIRQNKVLCKKANKLKSKFLMYAEVENHEHLESFIKGINFEGTLISNPRKNPRAVQSST
jgi:hypothetical protein